MIYVWLCIICKSSFSKGFFFNIDHFQSLYWICYNIASLCFMLWFVGHWDMIYIWLCIICFPDSVVINNLPPNAEDSRHSGSIPGSGRSPGEGTGNPLQYSWLEDSMDRRSLAGYSPWGCKESDMTDCTQYIIYIIYLGKVNRSINIIWGL